MKPFALNHAKLALADHRHNFFHWFFVVTLRILRSLIIVPLTAYMTGTGFFLATSQLRTFLPVSLLAKANSLSLQLPHFKPFIKFIIEFIDHWPEKGEVLTPPSPWWAIVVGIPLILLGFCIFWLNFFSLYYTIFSSSYNRTHCPFCMETITIKYPKKKSKKAAKTEKVEKKAKI